MQPGFDGQDAGTHDLRYFFVRESFKVPQDEDDPVVRRKGLDGLPKDLFSLLLEEQFLRGSHRRRAVFRKSRSLSTLMPMGSSTLPPRTLPPARSRRLRSLPAPD